MTRYIALLRGINVGGRHKLPMAELRGLCGELGLVDVQSYIQSGNLLFTASDAAAAVEAALEQAIARRFGFPAPVILREAARWSAYLADNPLREASELQPNLVMLALAKAPPRADAVAELRARAGEGERIEAAGDAIWLHFAAGAARSRRPPAPLDRAVGSPVTTRNWRTVQRLAELGG